jgi:hypothetical protein
VRNTDYEVLVFLLLLIAVLFAASGCGRGMEAPAAPHGEFEPYFQAFEAASIAHGRSTYGDAALPIAFGTISAEDAGECFRPAADNYTGHRYVTINPAYWATATEAQRTQTVFHELGHCLLNREHTSALMTLTRNDERVGVPVSIMFPDILGTDDGWEWDTLSAVWIDELFANAGH